MLRKKKKYSKPRKAYDIIRIKEENELVKKYGLKNKREIWKAEASISRIRRRGKSLITASIEKQQEFFNKLERIGFKTTKISEILDLKKEDWLKRRLQSILIQKNLATPKGARQLITHKNVMIDGKIVDVPGYIVKVSEENKIKIIKLSVKNIGDKNE